MACRLNLSEFFLKNGLIPCGKLYSIGFSYSSVSQIVVDADHKNSIFRDMLFLGLVKLFFFLQ